MPACSSHRGRSGRRRQGSCRQGSRHPGAKPTVVLVHGAFADSTSWNDVIRKLRHDRYPVVTVANPLRSLTGDATYLKEVLAGIDDPSSWPDTRTAAR